VGKMLNKKILEYTIENMHDDYYDVFISIDMLILKLEKNKLYKSDRELLIKVLNIIANLKHKEK
jgi:hypothetical protein